MAKAQARPPIKLLALHGFRTSGLIFKQQVQIAGLTQHLASVCDITYLDGPMTARGPPQPGVARFFEGPYYEWWNARQDPVTGTTVLDGCPEALAYLEDHMASHGPYDGLMGFSQGAALVSTVLAAQQAGVAFKDVAPPKLAILIGGLKNRDPRYDILYRRCTEDAGGIICPSMHIIGEEDSLKPASLDLVGLFSQPAATIITHPGGHVVPKLEEKALQCLLDFITTSASGPAG